MKFHFRTAATHFSISAITSSLKK